MLHLLRWLRAETSIDFEIILWQDGEIEDEFRELGPTTVVHRVGPRALLRAIERIGLPSVAGRIRGAKLRAWLLSRPRYDLIYLNGSSSAGALNFVPRRKDGKTVIAHIHEMGTGLRSFVPARDRMLLARVDRFIAAANWVKDSLVEDHSIPAERIAVHHEFVDVDEVVVADRDAAKARIRAELGIPADARVVLGCGTLEWRKGPDLFVQLGRLLQDHDPGPPVHLVWVGGETDGPAYWPLAHDVEHSGLGARVHFVASTEQRFDYFALADVFVLTSREDPFPLVCLEASILGTPVVSFDNGGMRELLVDGAGVIVPYLDVAAMAASVRRLLEDREAGRKLAETAAARVRAEHDVAVRAPGIYAEIERVRNH